MTDPCQHPDLGAKLDEIHKDIRTIMVNQESQKTEIIWIKGTSKIIITVIIPVIVSTALALYRSM